MMKNVRVNSAFALSAALIFAAGCASDLRRFPLADPVWVDQDKNHVPEKASKYYSGLMADGADMTFFYPLSNAFTFPLDTDAPNVNSADEVPNSSWFTNRIGLFDMTPEEAAMGSCDGNWLDPNAGKWTVIAAKPNGANPGFFIKAADGRRYLLKFDGPIQPQRATAADVIGSKIYHAAGFFVPCNQVVYFRPDIFEIDPKATAENRFGEDIPITQNDIQAVLDKAFRVKDGMLRASASEFVDGRPIGPFKYQDTRSDDPNDIIPHQDRRELRGARLLAAWLNHFDTREQNTLDVWAQEGEREFIRHYYIDFGDCFGSRWPTDQMSRRMGRSYYFDFAHVGVDLVTLGLLNRPWNKVEVHPEAEIFGYFGVDEFVPSEWRGGYRNPAFARMNHRDALWMARIIQRFTPDHIKAMVAAGKLDDKRAEAILVGLLLDRRRKILEEYLLDYSPIDRMQLVRRTPGDPAQSFCFEDLAVKEGLVDPRKVVYKLRFNTGAELELEKGWVQFQPDDEHPERSCVLMPLGVQRPHERVPAGAADDHPERYGQLNIFVHQTASVKPTSQISVYMYDLGPERGFKLVGIERPENPTMPALY